MKNATAVPPDGGYGWIIALAMALNSFIYIPLMQCFGLIFKDTFAELGLSAAQVALIINLHAAFGMITGLLNGVFLKLFGYRKMALVGAFLFTSGVTLTSSSNSFRSFIAFYGIVASLGVGVTKASNSLALNTYFKKRRNKAMAFAVTITGLGSVLLPQLINLLMKVYTPEGVMLIFGGICGHFFVTALLLQPVKWHMKEGGEQLDGLNPEEKYAKDAEIFDSHLSLNECEKKQKKNLLKNIVDTFDLDLLKDSIFINILVGLALAIFSELNFSVLIPFILSDFGLNRDQIATFISTAATTDIIFRFLAPYIGDYFKKPPRVMYILTLVVLIIVRFFLLLTRNFYLMLLSASGLGMAKGIRRVYVGLIVPSHVTLERLPSASGMEMMANGFCILTGGLLLGVVRDLTGSYNVCVIIMNCVSLITIIMWTLEAIFVKNTKKKKYSGDVKDVKEDIPLNKV